MAHAFSHVSLALSLCHRPILIHLPASGFTCRLWDIHLAEQREDGPVFSIMFSEDGSLLAITQSRTLCMWKTSTWERLWSVPCKGRRILSHDGLQVLIEYYGSKCHAHDALSGDALGEIDSMPNSLHDHVHMFSGKVGEGWKCRECYSSLRNGGYGFTNGDRWLWVVEERVPRRLIHIPAEYGYIYDIKSYSSYVAIGCDSGLLVLDTGVNPR